jgi:ribosome-binding protein aMBF1 (putative translation factor)
MTHNARAAAHLSLRERRGFRNAHQREGLSQRELAARLGVAPSTIKAWEAGTVKRPTSRVTRLFEEYVKEA